MVTTNTAILAGLFVLRRPLVLAFGSGLEKFV